MPRHFAFTAHGLLVLFGADFFGRKALPGGLAPAPRGRARAGAAGCLRRGAAVHPDIDLVNQLAVAGVLIGLTVYVLGQRVSDINSTREFAEVLPFSAVLAGRLLRAEADPGPGWCPRWPWCSPATWSAWARWPPPRRCRR